MRRIARTACVLTGLWAAAGQAAAPGTPDQVDLKFIYKPGGVVRQRMVSKTVGTMKLFDPLPEQKFSSTFEQDLTMKCRQVNADKSALVDMTMDRIAMKMSVAGMDVVFDSSAPASRPAEGADKEEVLRKLFSAMVGSTLTMTMGPDGQPIKVDGGKEMVKKMSDELAGAKVPAALRKMFDQIGSMFGDDNLMKEMQSCQRMIPGRGPVRIGEKWSRKWDMKMPMFNAVIEGEGQYELLGIEEFHGRRCAKIGVRESFRMGSAAPVEKAPDATTSAPAKGIFEQLHFELRSSGGDGTGYWDYENGVLVQLRQTQRMTMEIAFAPDGNAEDPQLKKGMPRMVQKLNTSVSVDLLDDAEAAASKAPAPAVTPK